MRIGVFLVILSAAIAAFGPAMAETSDPRGGVLAKAKRFSCSVEFAKRVVYATEDRKSKSAFSCTYFCNRDWNLVCASAEPACPKLVAKNVTASGFDLQGKRTGVAAGLDTTLLRQGSVDRRTGAVKFSSEEKYTFQGKLILTNFVEATGSCAP